MVIQKQTNMLPSTGFEIEGLEGLGQKDIILPRRAIIQPTSDRPGEKGSFYDNISEDSTPSIIAVILRISHAATKWGTDLSQRKAECRSNDGITGSTYGPCAECAFNAEVNPGLWELRGNDAKAKRCERGYELLCVDTADDSMFLLGVRGMSVRPLKKFVTHLVKTRRAPFQITVSLSTEHHKDAKGSYYTLNVEPLEPLQPAEAEAYRQRYQAMQGVHIYDVEEAEEAEPTGPAPF